MVLICALHSSQSALWVITKLNRSVALYHDVRHGWHSFALVLMSAGITALVRTIIVRRVQETVDMFKIIPEGDLTHRLPRTLTRGRQAVTLHVC